YPLSLLYFHAPSPPRINPPSLHDALPISADDFRSPESRSGWTSRRSWSIRIRTSVTCGAASVTAAASDPSGPRSATRATGGEERSEEHTSELQSRFDLVCRLLLEKKNTLK